MVSGSLALLYFLLGFHGGRQGSGHNRGQSPVEWGDFPYVCSSIHPSVRPFPPLGYPARLEAQPAMPEAQLAMPEPQPDRPEAQPARSEAQPASQPSLRVQAWLAGLQAWLDGLEGG